jgi:hypothetical protein
MPNVPESECPFCGVKLDAATHPKDRTLMPSPGNLSMCINCTSILKFDDNLHLVALTPQEFKKLPDEVQDRLYHMQRVTRDIDRTGL